MKTKDFESRIESYYGDMIFTCSDGYKLTITIPGAYNTVSTHLVIEMVDELKAVIAAWEQLYYSTAAGAKDSESEV